MPVRPQHDESHSVLMGECCFGPPNRNNTAQFSTLTATEAKFARSAVLFNTLGVTQNIQGSSNFPD